MSLRLTHNNENEARSSRFSGVKKRGSVYYEQVFSKEEERNFQGGNFFLL